MELKEGVKTNVSIADMGLGHLTVPDMGLGHITAETTNTEDK